MKPNKIMQMIGQSKVEWKPLDKVVIVVTAPAKVKREKYSMFGKIPIIDQGEKFISGYTNDDLPCVPKDEYIIFGDHSEHIKYVDFSFVQGADGLKILKSSLCNTKYVYYAFENFYQRENNYKRHWSTAKETLIPIPPLPVQKEIVKILDKLTELEATLEAELIMRRKQYQYYRDLLLTFETSELASLATASDSERQQRAAVVVWKTLGEVVEYSSTRIKYDVLNEQNYVGVDNLLQNRAGKTSSHYVPTTGNLTQFISGDILIGNIRPYLKKIWQADCEGGANGDVLVIRIKDTNINPRYLYQVLSDDKFFEYNMKYAKGAKMPRGNKQAILQFLIPIPPLATQQKIVEILDKFDTLTNSINEGLPKEIMLRRKQYEYYREKLLNFPKM